MLGCVQVEEKYDDLQGHALRMKEMIPWVLGNKTNELGPSERLNMTESLIFSRYMMPVIYY